MQKEFKVWYNNEPATQEQLDAIEEIVVEQEVDHAWEARIKLPVCIAEDGSWDGEDDAAYRESARVRIAARIGEGAWTVLIDGSIVSQEPDYNASPGMSAVTLLVHDDFCLLSSEPSNEDFGNQTDRELISALFEIDTVSEPADIGELPENPDTSATNNLRGTRINMLREMASRFGGFHAYVLPGDEPGKSKGVFRKFPDPPANELPVMYLTGSGRNISSFNIRRNTSRAARVEGASLNTHDMTVTDSSVGHADTPPAIGESSTAGDATTRVERIDPSEVESTDVLAATEAHAADSAYTLSAEGSIIPQTYTGILQPYKLVSVRVSNSRYSTDYVIKRVTHTLGRSEYTQGFSLLGNAVSPATSAGASAPAPSAAAAGAFAASFNIQMDII